MNIDQLRRGGFLGSLAERMALTKPGAMANAIDDILYHRTFDVAGSTMQVPSKVFCKPLDAPRKDATHQDTDKILREVFHYLEACALREVAQ